MAERFAIRLSKFAEKFLYKLPAKQFKQITTKIFSLQVEPRPQDCKLLKGQESLYRVDQGEYRIIYEINDDTIEVFRVGKRNDDEVYENL